MSSLHFEVIEQSHATAVSQIYEAVDKHKASRYLIEVVAASAFGGWLDGFKNDMAVLARLKHPCVLDVVDVGIMPDGAPVIVTERPEGISLQHWLSAGRVAPTEAAMDLITGISHVLGVAHGAGVSHGALCADNILLVPVAQHAIGFPRLRGFGHRWLRAAVSQGAASAMTPAHAERPVPADAREIAADIAALAVIADRLLTPLQRGPELAAVLRSAQLPGEARFASASAFVSSLELALPSAEGPDPADTPTPVLLAHRHRGIRRVLATAALTVMAAGAVHAMVGPQSPSGVPVSSVATSVRLPAVVPLPRSAPPAPAIAVAKPVAAAAPAPAPIPVVPVLDPPRQPVAAVSASGPPAAKSLPRPRAPRVWRVWSDTAQGVVLVDDDGRPVSPATP